MNRYGVYVKFDFKNLTDEEFWVSDKEDTTDYPTFPFKTRTDATKAWLEYVAYIGKEPEASFLVTINHKNGVITKHLLSGI